jgi:hypothetical protein
MCALQYNRSLGIACGAGSTSGKTLPTVDSLIAATALAYDLTIVTRNTQDFGGTGATVINPWEAS